MSTETGTETDPIEAPEAETGVDDDKGNAEDSRISKANQEAAKYRKELRAAQAELDKVRKAGLSEQEKAVAEAKAAGIAEAAKQNGPRLVRAEFRAAAAGQVDRQALDAYLEDVDLSKFLTEDGEPDEKAIAARIKRLGGGKAADFDGGARTPAAKGTDMNALIRRQAGLA